MGGHHRKTPSNFQTSWEPNVAEKIQKRMEESTQRPFMVSLVGFPGSGKGVSAFLLLRELEEKGLNVMIMPHDGYHYPMNILHMFPDAEDAIYRRGAPDTFDPRALYRDLKRIREEKEETLIRVPGFDHAKGDPEPDQHNFDRNLHDVVLCEGLYILHDEDGWEDIKDLFDYKIFMNSDVDICVERVKHRNKCIPGYTPEEIEIRAGEVDRANAMTVLKSKDYADIVVEGNLVMPQEHKESQTSNHKHHKTLSHVSLKDVEEAIQRDMDWTSDIVSRPRGESITSRVRSKNIASITSDPPPPAVSYVGTWEADMAKTIADSVAKAGPSDIYMVALAGFPGSGKSVSAFLLQYELEKLKIPTMIMPHDGYHYPLEYLKTFPDAADLIYRRGAPDTFDPLALHRDLTRIQNGMDEKIIKLPAFDHVRGDPEPDTHIFDRDHTKVLICEGLYLLHDKDGWEQIADIFDLKIFIDTNIDECIERVKIRNQCIPGYTPEEIAVRTEKVDRVNAMTVFNSKRRADIVVDSVASSNSTKA